jgi:uncharacterized protein YgiM (DUF1202 family)
MKKILFLILALALMSLACLESAAVSNQPAVISEKQTTAAVTDMPTADVSIATLTPSPSPKKQGETCARVIASDALNLRMESNEQSRILAWLKNNDVVIVVDTSNADWWYVESPLMSGYVRSSYLQKSECVK